MPTDIPRSIKTAYWRKITLILLSIVTTLFLLETGLRLSGFINRALQKYRIAARARQRGEYRILCLGGSATQNQYPSILETILNQKNTGIRFIVIDKGMAGTTTTILVNQIEAYLDTYQPDMVVVMVGMNDKGALLHDKPESSKIILRIKSMKTHKLIRSLWLNLVARAKERQSVLFIDGLKNTRADKENNIRDEDTLKKSLELNPGNDWAYVDLGWFCRAQNNLLQAEEYFKKALELNPGNSWAYAGLGWAYRNQNLLTDAEACETKALELNPNNGWARLELGWLYRAQGKLLQAENCLKKGLEYKPEYFSKLYAGLASIYEETGQVNLAKSYYNKAKELESGWYNPKTRHNFHTLKKILDMRKVRFVCMQYPVCDVKRLMRIFKNQDGIVFVDNETTFNEAVKREGYKQYFMDMFGGNFGHCTPKGNNLLAKNIADVILKEMLGE